MSDALHPGRAMIPRVTMVAPLEASAAVPGAGRGVLAVERVGTHSVVTQARATSPLRLLTPLNHGPAAWIYTSTHGGGLVDGDAIDLTIDVRRGAAAFVSTQASSKVYRSPGGTSAALRARVSGGGMLILVPDVVVCFAGSRYRQVQRFDVDAGGGLVALDWLSSGRRASGERWAFDSYESRLELHLEGELVICDPIALRAADAPLAPRMGRFDVVAALVIAGAPLAAEVRRLVEWSDRQPVTPRADRRVAATLVRDDVCLVRMAGRSVEDVGGLTRELLAFVPTVLGDDPWARKW